MRIRAVLFDLGGTLLDERDFDRWADEARRGYVEVEPEALAHSYLEVEREIDASPPAGDRDAVRLEFWRRTLERTSERPVSSDTAARFLDRIQRTDRSLPLYSDARRCLDALKAAKIELGVVSNSTSEARVRSLLDQAGILQYFSRIVSSGTEGVAKPDATIFRRAVERMGVRPEEALYVGDLPNTDARGASAAGLHALWLNREGTGLILDPPEITTLLEVPRWVRRLAAKAAADVARAPKQ